MIRAKIISSLEKVRLTDQLGDFDAVQVIKAARGERVSFQVVAEDPPGTENPRAMGLHLTLRSKLSKCIKGFFVGQVPMALPAYLERCSGDYITTEPGLIPDVLYPLKKQKYYTQPYSLVNFWFTAELPEDVEPGKYPVYITLKGVKDGVDAKVRVVIEVVEVRIPKSDLRFTQWFHCDCIASYFGVKMQSEKHWKLIEKFIAAAAHTGVNMILTPIFTPPLDTAIDSYRPTMQLVDIAKNGDTYTFGFEKLERWVALCKKYEISYFEMAHLFTQWGACATPKIEATVDGTAKRIFGWDVASDSPEYAKFLRQFLPALLSELEKLGIKENSYFHISDEPNASPDRPDLVNYGKAKNLVKPLLEGCKIMDALSHVEFFDNGLVEFPVPSTDHAEPFLTRKIQERWCYYCCSQGKLVANRFMSMPSYRNRVTGVQLYANGMDGFLHWGFNFYYSRHSEFPVDPYRVTDCIHAFPSGDAFSVYPYENGAIESLRAVVFYEGLQDRMLLKALEKKIGREAVENMLTDLVGKPVTFTECLDAKTLIAIHDKALELLV
ncbi:MAG: DUF4091 domain-containing protein [Clostridia bacterium]|nr:DUF4091 domain-containing protein [Clostridia bacterium]